jgi:hypothetical protein
VSLWPGRRKGQRAGFPSRLRQLVDNAAEQHRLALAGIFLDAQQLAFWFVAPLSKVDVFQNPAVRVLQQAAVGLLDPCLVVPRIRHPQVLQALTVPFIHLRGNLVSGSSAWDFRRVLSIVLAAAG